MLKKIVCEGDELGSIVELLGVDDFEEKESSGSGVILSGAGWRVNLPDTGWRDVKLFREERRISMVQIFDKLEKKMNMSGAFYDL